MYRLPIPKEAHRLSKQEKTITVYLLFQVDQQEHTFGVCKIYSSRNRAEEVCATATAAKDNEHVHYFVEAHEVTF